MAFDLLVPVAGSLSDADLIRENFVQIATHHQGPTAPPAPQSGYMWLDTSDSENHKLKIYSLGSWLLIFSHMESAPLPPYQILIEGFFLNKILTGGGTISFYSFLFKLSGAVPFIVDANVHESDLSGGETDVAVDDPQGTIVSYSFNTDANDHRWVQITHGGLPSSTYAILSWKWNGVPFYVKLFNS